MVRIKNGLYCERLTSNKHNKELIKDFVIDREKACRYEYERTGRIFGLELYLKHCAWESDLSNEARFYLIKTVFTNEIVAYFSLKCGLISVDSVFRNDNKENLAREQGVKLVPDTLSGIEIAHFAINDKYRKSHSKNGILVKGLGKYLYLDFILPIIRKANKLVAAQILYLYAADSSKDKKLVEYYNKTFMFKTVDNENYKPVTSYYDNDCIFMYRLL